MGRDPHRCASVFQGVLDQVVEGALQEAAIHPAAERCRDLHHHQPRPVTSGDLPAERLQGQPFAGAGADSLFADLPQLLIQGH